MSWQEGAVISIEARDSIYCMAQMLNEPYLVFFNIFHNSHDWPLVNLSDIPELHYCLVTQQFLQLSNKRRINHIDSKSIRSFPRYWIKPDSDTVYRTIWTSTSREMTICYLGGRGASLIEQDIFARGAAAWEPRKVIKKRIRFDDADTIDANNLTTFATYPLHNERLLLCCRANRDIDPYKDLIFSRPLPPEYENYMRILETPDEVVSSLKPGSLRIDPPAIYEN